jgi:hypothetical protein
MTIEKSRNEYIIKLPKDVFGSKYIDRLIADLKLIEISSKTKGSSNDINELVSSIDGQWLKTNSERFEK